MKRIAELGYKLSFPLLLLTQLFWYPVLITWWYRQAFCRVS